MKERLQRFTEKGILLRERFSKGIIIKSLIAFILSLVIFYTASNDILYALSGLGLIVSGSIIGLFVLIFLIFFFLERSLKNQAPQKKVAKKTTKKTVKKKSTKKTVSKKKTTAKKKK